MSHHDMDMVVLITYGVLLADVATVRISSRSSMPGLLLYLGISLGIDETGLGIRFDDTRLAYNVSALLVRSLLFGGGFTTRWVEFRSVASRAGLLGIARVLASVVVASPIAMLVLGINLRIGTLVAAMVSSTDVTTMFAILRRLPLRSRVRTILEGESGFNDPLTIIVVTVVVSGAWNQMSVTGMLADGLFQLTVDALIGAAMAMMGQAFLHRTSLPSAGLYLLATLVIALTAYSVAGVAGGSELLAAYIAGL